MRRIPLWRYAIIDFKKKKKKLVERLYNIMWAWILSYNEEDQTLNARPLPNLKPVQC